MTQYNTSNIKMSTSQLAKLKSRTKNGTEITLKLSSNVVHNLLSTNTQFPKLHKAFASDFWANIKLSKTQLHKIGQSRGFPGRSLESLLKTGLLLIGNVLKPFAEQVLIPLGLTAAVAATDAAIHKKIFGFGTTTLIISNEEMNEILKTVKSLEEFKLLIKAVSEKIKNEAKEQKGGFLTMLLGTLVASLLGNVLTFKEAIATSQGRKWSETLATRVNMPGGGAIAAGEGTVRAGQDF